MARPIAKERTEPKGAASYSQSVSRALQILDLFTPERSELGIAEISRGLGLPKANVQRLVAALSRHDYLDQNPASRKYRIGVAAFQTGSLFMNNRTLERLAEPHMHQLVAELGHTCHLSVLRDGFMVVIASVEGPGPIKYSAPVAYRLPLSTSAVGKATLAMFSEQEVDDILARGGMPKITPNSLTDPRQLKQELLETREKGYSVNWEENRPGVGSVAVPIASPEGKPIAVLSIGFPVSLVDKIELPHFGRILAERAGQLAIQISHKQPRRGLNGSLEDLP